MDDTNRIYNAAVDMVDRHVREGRGDKLAFIDERGTCTYGELVDRTNKVANALAALDVGRETRVALIMLDTIDFPSVFWGAIKAGIIPVALNTLLTGDQYKAILQDCRAEVLFVSHALLPTLEPVLKDLPCACPCGG